MSHETSTDNNTSSGYFDAGFDYRSLLPTTTEQRQQQESNHDDAPCLPSMTWRERCIGCGTCVVAGYLLSMGSFWRFKGLITGDPLPFVINVTIGNLIALAGSFFLMGPKAQVERMFHPCRRTATFLYIGSLAFTLLVVVLPLPLKGLLLVVLVVVQYVAVAWYCLSYIPFAQDAITVYLKRVMARGEG